MRKGETGGILRQWPGAQGISHNAGPRRWARGGVARLGRLCRSGPRAFLAQPPVAQARRTVRVGGPGVRADGRRAVWRYRTPSCHHAACARTLKSLSSSSLHWNEYHLPSCFLRTHWPCMRPWTMLPSSMSPSAQVRMPWPWGRRPAESVPPCQVVGFQFPLDPRHPLISAARGGCDGCEIKKPRMNHVTTM